VGDGVCGDILLLYGNWRVIFLRLLLFLLSQIDRLIMPQAPFRGRVQAQGDDINQHGGYSSSWAQQIPVTDEDGLSFLAKIEEQCNESQQFHRKQAFDKAKNFIKNASKQGGVGPESQPHPFQDPKYKILKARVDIEIHCGLTFIPMKKAK
jgi:hypothetical protein